jgi:hypothetical protein
MIDRLTDQEFQRHALEVLKRELGADGLARFLRLNRSGPGDYTTDRDQWQKNLTIDQVLESISKNRSGGRPIRRSRRSSTSISPVNSHLPKTGPGTSPHACYRSLSDTLADTKPVAIELPAQPLPNFALRH